MGASAASSILALAACGGTAGPAEEAPEESAETPEGEDEGAQNPNVLKVGQVTVAVGPNVWYQNDLNSATIMHLVCPPPVYIDEKGIKRCLLTEDPIVNYDATEWTITLKEGLRWNNGRPVTSEDVLFGAQYGVENNLGFHGAYYGDVDFYSTEIIDERTVRFVLDSPNVNFWNGAGYWVPFMRKSIWENVSKPSSLGTKYPGDGYGPYYVKEWEYGKHVRLARNEYCTQSELVPSIDEIVFTFYDDEAAAVQALLAGEIDVISNGIALESAATLAPNPSCKLSSIETLGYTMISFSQRVSVLQDRAVRQAFAMCIDRDALCSEAFSGAATPMFTPVSPVFSDLVQANITQPAFDIAGAAALLEEAGYTDSGDGVRAMDDQRLEFTLTYKETLPNVEAVMSIIIPDLEKAGFKINLDPVDASTFARNVVNGHDYELSYSSWGVLDDVDSTLITCFGIEERLNFMEFVDYEQEELLYAMQYEVDYDTRKELLDQWQAWFAENLPCVHLFVPHDTFAASTERFDGWNASYGEAGYITGTALHHVTLK